MTLAPHERRITVGQLKDMLGNYPDITEIMFCHEDGKTPLVFRQTEEGGPNVVKVVLGPSAETCDS